MALKTTIITIAKGRDKGKRFLITERPAKPIEVWILRVVFGLGKAGVEIPPEVLQLGPAPTAYLLASQISKLPSRLGLRLAEELMACVQRLEEHTTRALVDNDTEDVTTRLQLKQEVLKLEFGFFGDASSQNLDPQGSGTPQPKP